MTDQAAEQLAALAELGFSAPVNLGGMGLFDVPRQAVWCLTCGATVMLSPIVEGQAHPLDLHRGWHADTTGSSPDA